MSSQNSIPTCDVFLDSSALFAGVFSPGVASRLILTLGESGTVHLLVSSLVLAETEGALRRKAPEALGHLALLLDSAALAVTSNPSVERVRSWASIVPHLLDAAVLAAAVAAPADYFVTLDREHFLANDLLIARAPIRMGTPGDFLRWFRSTVGSA